METIDVKISKTGEIEYSVTGVKGRKCKELTKPIDEIAGRVLETKTTGEFCEVETTERAGVRQGGR